MSDTSNRSNSDIEQQEHEFFTAWSQIRQLGTQTNFKLAHEQGMSATQYTILGMIERAQGREPCTISWLASQMGIDPPTIVRSVDILERRGFVQRRRDTKDRRVVFVEFTEMGHMLQRELQQRFTGRLSTIFRSMSEKGRLALLQGLQEFLILGQQEESI